MYLYYLWCFILQKEVRNVGYKLKILELVITLSLKMISRLPVVKKVNLVRAIVTENFFGN